MRILNRKRIIISTYFSLGALLCFPSLSSAESARARAGPEKVLEVISSIESNLRSSRYQGGTVVRPHKGEYYFDCSGMAHWVLRRGAPLSLRALGRPQGFRPLARRYYRHISRIPLGKRRGPWFRVPHAARARPGDVITWERPPWFPSKSTGHVAFILSSPVYQEQPVRGYLYLVADSSRFKHQDDSRGEEQSGFGKGIMLLATDPEGQPNGYGWYGALTPPDWVVPVDIVIGRPLR